MKANEYSQRALGLYARPCWLLPILYCWLPAQAGTQESKGPDALSQPDKPRQFIAFNISGGSHEKVFSEVAKQFGPAHGKVQAGVAGIFSYLQQPPEKVRADLEQFLALSLRYQIPVVVQLDGEQWWGGRPDLWNWWDPKQPGFDPENRVNVEWSDWNPEAALRIAWRNWGRQLRVLPPPNLMSRRYREACHQEMNRLVPLIVKWWRELRPDQKHLLIGLKVGWESSIGVNAYHYPDGNRLLDQPAERDPSREVKGDELPGRGFVPIGYAAVKTAGLAESGQLKEADLAEVVRRHLEDLSKLASDLGMPRERLFTHCGGWKDGEVLYQSALNPYSCPGWSFYRYARDPAQDSAVRQALKRSDAPFWGAVEWLLMGASAEAEWRQALQRLLAMPKSRYVCIYNWNSIEKNPAAISAIRGVLNPPP